VTGVGCAAARDAAPELALGILDGSERAEVLGHLTTCARCQRYVSELAGVADGLARLAPEAEPPVGFGRRVDAELRGGRRRAVRRWVTTVAVTAAAAAILAVVIVRVVEAGSPTRPVAAPTLRSAAMIGSTGVRVGDVASSNTNPSSLVVTVDYAVPDGTYQLELRTGGGRHGIGAITITAGRGRWIGAASVSGTDPVTIALVNQGGGVVCQASLGAAAS
jgi:predicted anti-sigma-YlaC factor YlaD